MKNILLIIVAFVLTSFAIGYEPKNSTAEVEQIQGCYIFVDSRPIKKYEYLGTCKYTIALASTQYQSVRDKLIKKIKKEYPDADGIIFHFHDGGQDRADAIKFD